MPSLNRNLATTDLASNEAVSLLAEGIDCIFIVQRSRFLEIVIAIGNQHVRINVCFRRADTHHALTVPA
jgi:hypothetical protein